MAWITVKYLFYGFVIFFLVNLIFIFLRERFELEGCVLCIEKEVDKIQALVQTQRDNFVQSQIRDGLEPNNSESLLKQATWHFCRSLLDMLNIVY